MATSDITYVEFVLPTVFDPSGLEALKVLVENVTLLLTTTIDLMVGLLETVETFLLPDGRFATFIALAELVISQLNDLLQGMLDAGVYLAHIVPSLGDPLSMDDCFDRLANSVVDVFDPDRPITSNSNEVDYILVAILGEALTFGGIEEFLSRAAKLVDLDILFNLLETVEAGRRSSGTQIGASQKPDWQSATVVDIFPFVAPVLQVLQSLLDTISITPGLSELLEELIVVLQIKKAQLEALSDAVELAINSLIIDVGQLQLLVIQGKGDATDLRTAILQAKQEFPSQYEDLEGTFVGDTTVEDLESVEGGLGAIIATAAVGPDVQLLQRVFGV